MRGVGLSARRCELDQMELQLHSWLKEAVSEGF